MRKYRIIAYLMLLAIIMIMLYVIHYSSANTNMISFSGTGDADYSYADSGSSGRVMVDDATINAKRTYSADAGSSNASDTNSILISGANGGLYNRYETVHKGAGDKITSKVINIVGDFEGYSNYQLTVTPSGAESLDSKITLDAGNGSAKFAFRVYNLSSGKPATEQELDAVGNFTIDAWNNLSYEEQKAVAEDPLKFCIDLDKDVSLSGEGTYIVPDGYDLVDGNLVKNTTVSEQEPSAYYITNETGTYSKNGGSSAYQKNDGSKGVSAGSGATSIDVNPNGSVNKIVAGNIVGTGNSKGTVDWAIY